MKLISVSILFICLFAASFNQWLVIAAFEINQRYIAEELCVNRNNPYSHCNGQCYLCKQMSNQEKSDGTSNGLKEKFEVQLFFSEQTDNKPNLFSSTTKQYAAVKPFTPQDVLHTCFHPPCFG